MDALQKGFKIVKILSRFGEAYIVGGAVRDLITNEKEPDDIDISTNVPMRKIEELFKTHDIGKNKDFGIVVVDYEGDSFEIAQFRTDGIYSDGRRPDDVNFVKSFQEDCLRRDFTINAIGIDENSIIIDFNNGTEDIKNRIIRTVGNPYKRFSEDYLRMLRAIRFSARLGFTIEEETKEAIKELAYNINIISPERIIKELFKMAECDGKTFSLAIIELKETGLLKHILPEIDCMDQFEHQEKWHPEGNVFCHTIEAIRCNPYKDRDLNLALLFHDVGKPISRSYRDDGRVSYLDHAKNGLDLIDSISDRLKFDNDLREKLIFVCKNHMRLHMFKDLKNSKLYKLIMDKNWDLLLKATYFDDKCRLHIFDEQIWDDLDSKVEDLKIRYADKKEKDKIKEVVSGKRVMELTGLTEGPEIGRIIKSTIQWIIDNNIKLEELKLINNYIMEQIK